VGLVSFDHLDPLFESTNFFGGHVAELFRQKARWVRRAPLGVPVVPDVYCICATSSALIDGNAVRASPLLRNSCHEDRAMTSRRSGSVSRTALSACTRFRFL